MKAVAPVASVNSVPITCAKLLTYDSAWRAVLRPVVLKNFLQLLWLIELIYRGGFRTGHFLESGCSQLEQGLLDVVEIVVSRWRVEGEKKSRKKLCPCDFA